MSALERELQAMLDYEPQHVSTLTDRSARSILGSTLQADGYHNAIMLAAGELVAAGMGFYHYQGTYTGNDSGHGSTFWTRYPTMHKESRVTVVDYYGRID